ncbi:MAG: Hsp20/alpha crystallin family protein [Pseudomonadota bacterium]|nr:Hsp20/alpha crystallin family protein [Pseudomonadota bacterium]
MAMRDLIPWGRQDSNVPATFRDEERSPFMTLRREMDRLFDDFFSTPMLSGGWGRQMAWPSLEVNETDNEVRITAELPGMSEKDVELTVQDGMLTLRGEKKSENEDRDRGWSERFYGRFERRLMLPDGVDEDGCKAEFRDGILSITMPKSEQARRSRRIPINPETRH